MNVIVRGRRFCSGGKSLGKMDFEFKNKRVAFYIIHSLERFSCPAGTELKHFFCLVNKSLSLLTDFFSPLVLLVALWLSLDLSEKKKACQIYLEMLDPPK